MNSCHYVCAFLENTKLNLISVRFIISLNYYCIYDLHTHTHESFCDRVPNAWGWAPKTKAHTKSQHTRIMPPHVLSIIYFVIASERDLFIVDDDGMDVAFAHWTKFHICSNGNLRTIYVCSKIFLNILRFQVPINHVRSIGMQAAVQRHVIEVTCSIHELVSFSCSFR